MNKSQTYTFIRILILFIALYSLSFAGTGNDIISSNSNTTDIEPKKISLTGNINQLKGFFKALDNSKKQVVRIAHYGDSSLLGDVISEYLRYEFQKNYGGEGAGFISLCASDVTMRKSSNQSFSDDWKYTSIFLRNPDQLPLGISGYIATPTDKSKVTFHTTHHIKNLKEYKEAKIYYSNANSNSTIDVTIDNNKHFAVTLDPGKVLQEKVLFNEKTSSVELSFNSCANTYFYGVSFENGNGVYLDNFPITGNTGVSLLEISEDMLKQTKKYLDYNLIILHYGMNLPTPKGGTLKIYKDKMLRVVKHYQRVFPNAGIIMVGISDRIMKKGNRIITSRETYSIIDVQEEIAKEAGVAFWNLFEAMGGQDSMDKWVESAPPLALKDYRHFTHEGGEIVAKYFFDSIMESYNKR